MILLPLAITLLVALQWRVEPKIFYPIHTELCLACSCASFVQVTTFTAHTMVQSLCHVLKTRFHRTLPHSLTHTALFYLPWCSLSLGPDGAGEVNIDVPFRAEHSICYSQPLDQLCISAFIDCCSLHTEASLTAVGASQVCGCKHKHLEGSLIEWPFIRFYPRAYGVPRNGLCTRVAVPGLVYLSS